MKEWNGKSVKKWHSAMDKNGNKVVKSFMKMEQWKLSEVETLHICHGQVINITSHCLDCITVNREK